jgi:hypothetical protein
MSWPPAWDGYDEAEAELMRVRDQDASIAWCEQRYGADRVGSSPGSAVSGPPPDLALFDDEEIGAGLATTSEALRQGVVGYARDIDTVVLSAPYLAKPPHLPCSTVARRRCPTRAVTHPCSGRFISP